MKISETSFENLSVKENANYDVIVVGGGPAGTAAAAAAAREGAKTLLLEASGMLGGMGTLGLVNGFPTHSDGIHLVYGGFANRILTRMWENAPYTVKRVSAKWNTIDFEALKFAYDELITESDADVLFHTRVVAVNREGRRITSLLAAEKDGLTVYKAKVFIDCTGDADLYAFAGEPVLKGDEDGGLQPGSLCFIIAGVDDDAYKTVNDRYYTGEGPKSRAMINRILADGKYNIPDNHYVPRRMDSGIYSYNAGHLYDFDGTDPVSISKATFEGRRIAHEYFNALKEYAPEAFGKAVLLETASTVGVRETRRIVGDYTFTLEDYLARRSFPDEIFRGLYPIDVHETTKEKEKTNDTLSEFPRYGEGESYGVPYRILCPRGLDNLLVAGRAVSCDRLSNGSLRVMPCCIMGGEASGIAATLASRDAEPNIHRINTDLLRKRLREEGAYIL